MRTTKTLISLMSVFARGGEGEEGVGEAHVKWYVVAKMVLRCLSIFERKPQNYFRFSVFDTELYV